MLFRGQACRRKENEAQAANRFRNLVTHDAMLARKALDSLLSLLADMGIKASLKDQGDRLQSGIG